MDLGALALPVIGAPMAGVSTPALVAAVDRAGGLGMLAAGYGTAEQLFADVAQSRRLGASRVGVNVFVPGEDPALSEVGAHRDRLLPLARRRGINLPEHIGLTDAYPEVVAGLLADPVALVSFTFGLPEAGVIEALHEVDTLVVATVTSPAEAAAAATAGADALVVQSYRAGGHRGTFDPDDPGGTEELPELLAAVASAVGPTVGLIAAGAIVDRDSAVAAFEAGAWVVQVGTLLLAADEAGTHPTYRRAVLDPTRSDTTVTRVFSGRAARGLRNTATESWPSPPVAYPAVHDLTAGLRAAAATADDPEEMSLWAGTGIAAVRAAPAAELLAQLDLPRR